MTTSTGSAKYEITNAQYAEFLNAVAATDTYSLYNTNMAENMYGGITRSGSSGSYTYSAIAGREDMPVNYVSFYDSLRFANWLHNGQPTGAQDSTTTEDGAYTITAQGIANNSITRNADATVFLTSEDEWYKAAYYDASMLGYNPYPYADGFRGGTCEAPAGTTSHSANCYWAVGGLTDVGAYTGSPSEYATFDQGGNIFEWNEAIVDFRRGLRGGSFDIRPVWHAAFSRGYTYSNRQDVAIGFRVASLPVDPDPVCADGLDNDGDGLTDHPDDPGCFNPFWFTEDPQCQDGIDNDPGQDTQDLVDYDGGQSIWGECTGDPGGCPAFVSDPEGDGVANPDPQCANPWQNREARCGLGTELAMLLPPLMWMWRRRRGV